MNGKHQIIEIDESKMTTHTFLYHYSYLWNCFLKWLTHL